MRGREKNSSSSSSTSVAASPESINPNQNGTDDAPRRRRVHPTSKWIQRNRICTNSVKKSIHPVMPPVAKSRLHAIDIFNPTHILFTHTQIGSTKSIHRWLSRNERTNGVVVCTNAEFSTDRSRRRASTRPLSVVVRPSTRYERNKLQRNTFRDRDLDRSVDDTQEDA